MEHDRIRLDRVGKRTGACRGAAAKVLTECPLQLAVLAQRGRGVAGHGQKAHQLSVGLLKNRVQVHGAARIIQRPARLALIFQQWQQRVHGSPKALRQSLLLRQKPVLVKAGKQRTLVQIRRLSEKVHPLGAVP